MISRLLDRRDFQRLLEAPDYNGVLGLLEDTEYGPDVEEAVLQGMHPTNVDRALARNMERNFNRIKEFIVGRPQELINILFSRWDLYNLKTVLRGKQALVPNAEISRNLVPVGALDLVTLEELINQPDVRAVLDAMVMFSPRWWIPYGRAVVPHMAEYLRERNLSVIETALDKFHYREVQRLLKGRNGNAGLVKKVIGMEVDVLNLMTLLRVCGLGLNKDELREYYIPGGSLEEDFFLRTAALERPEKVLDVLTEKTEYREPLERGKRGFEEKGEQAVQDELDRYLIHRCLHLTRDPLGIGVIIIYMWKKYLEILNLRIIIRGKSIGLIESQIRKELFLLEEPEKT